MQMNASAPPRLLTVRQVAKRLNLSELTIRRRIARGDIPAIQVGGKHGPVRVNEAELSERLYGARTEAVDR